MEVTLILVLALLALPLARQLLSLRQRDNDPGNDFASPINGAVQGRWERYDRKRFTN